MRKDVASILVLLVTGYVFVVMTSPSRLSVLASHSTSTPAATSRNHWRQTVGSQPARLPTEYKVQVAALAFSPDGTTFAISGGGRRDSTVDVWQTQTRQLRYVLRTGRDSNIDLAFSPDGRILATSGYGSAIKLWDVQTGSSTLTVAESSTFVKV